MGKTVPGGTVIALTGGLGAGKTVFAKGLARGLGVIDEVTSPTYTIVSEYQGRLRFHHIDAYRLAGPADFESVGGEDLVTDSGGVCLIEWSERVASALPPGAQAVDISVDDDGSRVLRIEGETLEASLR